MELLLIGSQDVLTAGLQTLEHGTILSLCRSIATLLHLDSTMDSSSSSLSRIQRGEASGSKFITMTVQRGDLKRRVRGDGCTLVGEGSATKHKQTLLIQLDRSSTAQIEPCLRLMPLAEQPMRLHSITGVS